MATCTDNVTDIRILAKEAESSKSTTSYVCQSVIVPSDMMGYKTVVSSQPVSLADHLVGERSRVLKRGLKRFLKEVLDVLVQVTLATPAFNPASQPSRHTL